MVVFRLTIMTALLWAVMGCMSQIRLVHIEGSENTPEYSFTEVTYKGRTKDLADVNMRWLDTFSLKLGAATTATDPYNELLIEVGGPVVKSALCTQNPLFCTGD